MKHLIIALAFATLIIENFEDGTSQITEIQTPVSQSSSETILDTSHNLDDLVDYCMQICQNKGGSYATCAVRCSW